MTLASEWLRRSEIRALPEVIPADWKDFDFKDLSAVSGQMGLFRDWVEAAPRERAGELAQAISAFSNAFMRAHKVTETIERDYLEPLSTLARLAREKKESVVEVSAKPARKEELSPAVAAAIRRLYVHDSTGNRFTFPIEVDRDRVFGGAGAVDADIIYGRGVRTFRELGINAGDTVLDIGAGKFGGLGLVAALAGAHVTAYENYAPALADIKTRLAEVRAQIEAAGGSYTLIETDFAADKAEAGLTRFGFDHVIATDVMTPTPAGAAANAKAPLVTGRDASMIMAKIGLFKSRKEGSVLISSPEFYSRQDIYGRPLSTIKKVPFDDELLAVLKTAGTPGRIHAYVAVPFSMGIQRGLLVKAGSRSELRETAGSALAGLDARQSIKESKTPVMVYIDYEELVTGFSQAQREELFALAYMHSDKVRLVFYGVKDAAHPYLKPFRELRETKGNIWINSREAEQAFDNTQRDFAKGWKKFRSIHLSRKTEGMNGFSAASSARLGFFKYKIEDEESGLLAAALLWAQYDEAGKSLEGLEKDSQGYLTLSENYLRDVIQKYESRLIVMIAA